MIAHVILFRPKADLDEAGRARLFDAMRAAHGAIPHIRRFVVGRRVKNGRPYEALTREFPFFALLEFETQADFDAYLSHAAHEELGTQFYLASEAAEAYDFETGDMPGALDRLRQEP
ncbi:MAG TPA: Dabb family protein [Vicinamibacterales bacterium]